MAEVYAILMCCRICIDKDYKSKCIHICSESQVSLFALCRYNFTSHIIWECYTWLCQLAVGNIVTLYWVFGHSGIQGSEIADELGRNGSSIPFLVLIQPLGYRVALLGILSLIFLGKSSI